MFIVWGKKIKRQKLGFVADYCPSCRDLRTFAVRRVGTASHVYYISFGDGELVGYERLCQACSTCFEAWPDTYAGMSKEVRPPADLVSQTFPNYYTAYKQQMELERKVRDTPSLLTVAERRTRLREPFAILAADVQQKLGAVQVDGLVWIAIAAFFPLVWLGGWIAELISPEVPDERIAIGAILVGAGLIGSQLLMSGQRYLRRKVVPRLAQSLAPLKPTHSELQDVVQELKQRKLKLSRIKVADIQQDIEQIRGAI